jgi:hypothetical protein
MILESIVASVLAPAAVDLIKQGFGALSRRWLGISVDDQIKLENATVGRMQALAQLDNPVGSPSQWVVDLRESARYIMAGVCILAGIGVIVMVPTQFEVGAQLVSMPFGFIFGERMYLTMGGKPK